MTPSWSAAGAARHYNLRLSTEGLRPGHGPAALGPAPGFKGLRLTAGRRPKGDYVGPIPSPRLDRSRRYVGPMLALCWPMSALCWPKLALSCPYVGRSWPYLASMLALCWPMLALCWASATANYVKTPSTGHFFRSGPPSTPQNHVKRMVF